MIFKLSYVLEGWKILFSCSRGLENTVLLFSCSRGLENMVLLFSRVGKYCSLVLLFSRVVKSWQKPFDVTNEEAFSLWVFANKVILSLWRLWNDHELLTWPRNLEYLASLLDHLCHSNLINLRSGLAFLTFGHRKTEQPHLLLAASSPPHLLTSYLKPHLLLAFFSPPRLSLSP